MDASRLGSVGLAVVLTASALAPAYAGPPVEPPGPACAAPLLPDAAPAGEAIDELSGREKRSVALINATTVTELVADARADDALWLDECGRALYVEEPRPAAAVLQPQSAAASVAPLEETFALASRPGAKRTIYLDFTGDTVTGTIWNAELGQASFTVPPYTIDRSAGFSSAELTQVQRAWAIVAEDYAPFDVNVTTEEPGPAAIDRASAADDVYGTRVVVTAGGPVWEANNRPGGISYLRIVDHYGTGGYAGHGYYQPSWVFTNGSGTDGKGIGEAAAHEVGHAFGLRHDGIDSGTASDQEYYRGSGAWAPIMGAGYYAPLTQWSSGEYAGATNGEDDVGTIAAVAPYVGDDHANTTAGATPIDLGGTRSGLIGTRGDRDTFVFAAAGRTTVTAVPTALQPDLDVSLTVRDGAGRVVATADPPVAKVSGAVADGLDAAVGFDAPTQGAWFTAVVDGTGHGSPAVAGQYSDYGSLGRYEISVGAAGTGAVDPAALPAEVRPAVAPTVPVRPVASPLTFRRAKLGAARVGRRYRGVVTVAGAAHRVRWTRRGRLPAGLRVRVLDRGMKVALAGKPRRPGRYTFVLRGSDAAGRTVARTFRIVVRR